jgi:tRNA (Thr-GGU) A37 N-methylase
MTTFTMEPIGWVQSARAEPIDVVATVQLDEPRSAADSLRGLDEVRGLDAIDGTPVLDIKPYMTEFAPRAAVRQPDWSHELMTG